MIEKVKYSCGCGFKTEKKREAVKHVKELSHCVGVYGELRPTEEEKEEE